MKSIDQGLAPIRAVKHAISREVGHDPGRGARWPEAGIRKRCRKALVAAQVARTPPTLDRGPVHASAKGAAFHVFQ
jgi:hypothetical protein